MILSVVCDFVLSSLSFDYEDSDSEAESFQKIRGERFELISGLAHEAKILKILKFHEIVEFGDVLGAENALGSCAARNV